ncbi:FecR family protein [Mucilaginibacter sp. CAU 1740]|uniref:FecR family protein n=1 Tax=Mucilaginibacter sp. CAU 1740 TaxID=3140365 RepID=UPI00325ADBF5
MIHYLNKGPDPITAQPIMTPEEYIKLYEKFASGSCTPEEEVRLLEYQDEFHLPETGDEQAINPADKQKRALIYSRIRESITERPQQRRTLQMWGWIAAAAVIVLVSGIFFLQKKQPVQNSMAVNRTKKSPFKAIKPGRNTAVLTLANGSSITLDSAQNGVLATSGKTAIKKLANGLIEYSSNNTDQSAAQPAMNTISVPRGGQYTIKLPDGTMVWLNSASSLSYPVAFNGATRNVTLSGEAYFEVTKNPHQPFTVHTDNVDVKVLGTHFNVEAYADDKNSKTTLLEGSVNLSNQNSSALLVPGQQGVSTTGQNIFTHSVNVNQVIAWKTGYFLFRENDIREIMKQISRWYDVEVEYEGNITHKTFGGIYSKNKDINELLKGLELTGLVHFKIEERRIIVMN